MPLVQDPLDAHVNLALLALLLSVLLYPPLCSVISATVLTDHLPESLHARYAPAPRAPSPLLVSSSSPPSPLLSTPAVPLRVVSLQPAPHSNTPLLMRPVPGFPSPSTPTSSTSPPPPPQPLFPPHPSPQPPHSPLSPQPGVHDTSSAAPTGNTPVQVSVRPEIVPAETSLVATGTPAGSAERARKESQGASALSADEQENRKSPGGCPLSLPHFGIWWSLNAYFGHFRSASYPDTSLA